VAYRKFVEELPGVFAKGVPSRKFVEDLAGAFVKGHDFSRAAKAQK
jgi:hypothetical protein